MAGRPRSGGPLVRDSAGRGLPVPETERDPDAAPPPSAGQPSAPGSCGSACRFRLGSAVSAFAIRLRLILASVARICRPPHLHSWLNGYAYG